MVNYKGVSRLSLSVLLLLTLLFNSGCYSSKEPDEMAYAMLVGIDHGAQNLVRISYLIAIPGSIAGGEGGGGGGGGSETAFVVTVSAPSIVASMNMVNSFVGRKLSLMHVKGFLFSEAMAKDGSMIKYISSLTQFRETRGTAFVGVCRDKPEDFFNKLKPKIEANPAKYFEQLAANEGFTGFMPKTHLQSFYNELKVHGASPVTPIFALSDEKLPKHTGQPEYVPEGDYTAGQMVKKGGVPIDTMGAAIFNDEKMVGTINGQETSIYSMFRGGFRRGIFTIRDPISPEDIITVEVTESNVPNIDIKLVKGKPVIDVKIVLEGNVLGNLSLVDYAEPQNRVMLEQAMEKLIQKRAVALVERTQQEFKADILGFGLQARHLAWTRQGWIDLKWQNLFREAQISIAVDFKIRRTGLLFHLKPINNL